VHIALYRIAQEALNNVVKHARANQVNILVSCSHCGKEETRPNVPREITLEVSDDGRGFDQNQVQPDHLGLSIMQERADDIDARLQIKSEPGSGTMIEVIWEDGPGPE
jgi:signal transduction histidine kinase